MSNSWYIKLRRSSQDNPLYFAEPFTRWQARQDLLLLANHSDGFFYIRGNRVDVQRWQVARGEKDLCARRKWSRNKTRKFLNDLENMQQIVQQKNRLCSVYIITNYDRYQTTDRTTEGTTEGQQKVQQKDINNKNKKNKEENNIYDFEDFWVTYNKKVGDKRKVESKFNKLSDEDKQKIKDTLPFFLARIQDKQFQPYPETYINQHRRNDEVDIKEMSENDRIKEYAKLGYTKFKETYWDDEYRRVRELRANQSFRSLSL